MALHFTKEEFEARRHRTCAALAARGLDGLLMFRQESMYWLTGYDSFGFTFFQCLYLGVDDTIMLMTRAPDLRQARHTSLVTDIRIWEDRDGADPARQLRDHLESLGCQGKRLGVEWASHGLTAANGKLLDAALDGFCALDDASDLVARLRLVKSPAEMAFVRRAAELADDAWEAALGEAGPHADEGAILAAMHNAIFRGGGDYPANPFIIGSGDDALLCRYKAGRRRLSARDQLTLEWAGVYRQYHAAMMRTLPIGPVGDDHQAMFAACAEALMACREALRPGGRVGDVFDAHARVLDEAGYREHRLNACGYALGTMYAPSWMDWPMFYHGNPVELAPGMVFFVHIILMDSTAGRAMTLGETYEVRADGARPLSRTPIELVSR